MYPTSARWDAAIRTSHEVVSRVEVWRGGIFTGSTLAILGGEVGLDESSNVRRTLRITSADVDLMPDDLGALLSPVDTDLKVFSGVRYTEGDTELVPMGVFRLETPSRGSLASGLDIDGADYASVLQRARFLAPWNTAKGALVTAQIAAMVTEVLPWVEVVDLTGSRAASPGAVYEVERWDAIEELSKSIGAEAAFDPDGRLVIRPTPTVSTVAAWSVDSMTESSVLLDAGVSLSTANVYNGVVATSSDSEAPPVSATVVQSTGPLRWRSGFMQPRFYSSPLLKTTADCVNAATSILVRSLAYAQTLSPVSAPNPALDVGDTLAITLPGKDPVLRVLTRASISLGLSGMPLEVRMDVDAVDLEGLS